MSNNTRLDIADVGEGSAGILCVTESQTCCNNASNSRWYSPNGVAVQEDSVGATSLYVTREVGRLHLNRITGGASGLYLCDVPDQLGTQQLLYIGLYDDSLSTGRLIGIYMVCTVIHVKFDQSSHTESLDKVYLEEHTY